MTGILKSYRFACFLMDHNNLRIYFRLNFSVTTGDAFLSEKVAGNSHVPFFWLRRSFPDISLVA